MTARSALAQLRQHTQAQHAIVDAMFPNGIGAPDDYARYLRGMHAAISAFAGIDTQLQQIYRTTLLHLERDMRLLRLPALPSPAVSLGGDSVCERPPDLCSDQRLGVRYVIDGSAMGARVLIRHVQLSDRADSEATRFLAYHLRRGNAAWPRLRARLSTLSIDPAASHAMVGGAQRAFDTFAWCFSQADARSET